MLYVTVQCDMLYVTVQCDISCTSGNVEQRTLGLELKYSINLDYLFIHLFKPTNPTYKPLSEALCFCYKTFPGS